MQPDHEWAREEIPAYAAGRLEAKALQRLKEHLAACGECREAAAETIAIASALADAPEGFFERHPDIGELQAYASHPGLPESDAIRRHLSSCDACALEVSAWRHRRSGESPHTPSLPPVVLSRRLWPVAAAALAAGLAIGVGVGPLFRRSAAPPLAGAAGPSVSPQVPPGPVPSDSAPKAGPSEPPSSWSGRVPALVLSDALRGEETSPAVAVEEGQPYVLISVALEILDPTLRGGTFRFEIRDTAGNTAWDLTLPGEEVAHDLRERRSVSLLCPSSRLRNGSYELRVRRTDRGSDSPLLQAPFTVETVISSRPPPQTPSR